MGFTDPDDAEEDDVGVRFDEVHTHEPLNAHPVNLLGPGPVFASRLLGERGMVQAGPDELEFAEVVGERVFMVVPRVDRD